MGAVLLVTRTELRRRWRSLALIVVLVGLAGGAALGSIAGARRTSSSFDRFLVASRVQDVLLLSRDIGPEQLVRLRDLPGVEAVGVGRHLALTGADGDLLAGGAVFAPVDDVLGRDVFRVRIVDGRAPAEGTAEEIMVSETYARTSGLRVGDSLPLTAFTPEQMELLTQGLDAGEPTDLHVSLRVVGITRSPDDLNLQASAGGVLVLPRAFNEKYGDRIGSYYEAIIGVRLEHGEAGVIGFVDRLDRVLTPGTYDVDPVALSRGGVQESIDLLAAAALLLGLIAAACGLIAAGLTAARQIGLSASDYGLLRALGLAPKWRAAAVAGPVLAATGTGTVLATLVAWATSALFPFGVAGDAEPHPGFSFDAVTILAGAVAIVGLVGALAAVAAWRAVAASTAGAASPLRPSSLTRALERAGTSPPVTVGVRMALEPGRGRSAVPVRSALAGAFLAVLGVTGVLVFGASLDHLLATPAAQGRSWDAAVSDTEARPVDEAQRCGATETRLTDQPGIEAVAMACSANLTIGGRGVGAIGLTPLRGSIRPTVLAGRAPDGPDEVALGTQTLAALGLDLGDRVTVQTPDGPVDYRVVGRVVVPRLVDAQAIADGAVLTGAGFGRVLDATADTSAAIVIRVRPGLDRDAVLDRVEQLPGIVDPLGPGVTPSALPIEVERLDQIHRIPDALAGFVGVLGALAVGHLLGTSVRRRSRDLAVLKSLGFSHHQLMATVAWQAWTVAGFGIITGITGGVAAGARLWQATTDNVGVATTTDTPIPALALLAAATLAVASLVAALPARRAAKVPAAAILRTE
jgi:hypothetical protein